MITGILTSVLTLVITHFVSDDAKAMEIAQQVAGLIMLGVSVYAGSQGIADHGDITYSKEKIDNDAIKKIIDNSAK